MTLIIRHKKVSAVADSADASLVQASDWNDEHEIVGAPAGGAVTVVQASGVLAQNGVLTINHAADAGFKRVVSLVKHVVTTAGRLNPVLAADDVRATSSGSYGGLANYAAWRGFRHDSGAGASTDLTFESAITSPTWLAWDFVEPVTISGVGFSSYMATTMPSSCIVQGSSDGAAWVNVHAFSPAVQAAYQYIALPTPAGYRRWRLYFPVASARGDTMLAGVGFFGVAQTLYRPASQGDFDVLLLPDETRITRLASGSEALTASVWLP